MPPQIKLESVSGQGPVEITKADSGSIVFGRSAECTVTVDSNAISRRHACLTEAGSQWVFTDLGSTNGSSLNGEEVKPGQVKIVRDGDVLSLADFMVRCQEVNHVSDSALQGGFGSSLRPPSVLVFSAGKFQTEFPLVTNGSRFVIGGPDGDFYLNGEPTEVTQLEVVFRAGRLELISGNGRIPILVNGVSVRGNNPLNDRDEVDIGPYRILINNLSADVLASPNLKAEKELSNIPGRSAATTVQSHPEPNFNRARATIIANPEEFAQMSESSSVHSSSFDSSTVATGNETSPSAIGHVPTLNPKDSVTPDAVSRESASIESATSEKSSGAKKFVFSPPNAQQVRDPASTMTLNRRGGAPGYELSASQRFSAVLDDGSDAGGGSGMSEKVLVIFGAIIFAVVVGFFLLLFF